MIAKQLEQIQVKTQEAQGVSNDDLVGKKHMMNSVQEVTAEQALRDKLLRQQNQYRILAEKQEHLEKLLRSKNAEVTQLREDKRHLLPTPPKKGNSRPANSPLITRVDRDKNGLFGTPPAIVKRKPRKARQTAGSAPPRGCFSDFPPEPSLP